jgi:hypothetical protein
MEKTVITNNIKPKLTFKCLFHEKEIPSYCNDKSELINHLSKCLARIYLDTHKSKIDKAIKDYKNNLETQEKW